MSKQYGEISEELARWLGEQHLFVVATAPLAADGRINCSPKGMDSFRVLGPREVAYLDLTGSGIETVAHLRENGRIVFMFCAFAGPPRIVRLHGTACNHASGSAEFARLRNLFPDLPGARGIIHATLTHVSDSCGFAVPLYEFAGERDTLVRWAESKGPDGLSSYRRERNTASVDGLPGFDGED